MYKYQALHNHLSCEFLIEALAVAGDKPSGRACTVYTIIDEHAAGRTVAATGAVAARTAGMAPRGHSLRQSATAATAASVAASTTAAEHGRHVRNDSCVAARAARATFCEPSVTFMLRRVEIRPFQASGIAIFSRVAHSGTATAASARNANLTA